MNEPILKVVNLSHRYSVQWAVKEINFEIPTKGIYGMLGSNGAGKSTLMNIICGVINPTRGDVYICGIDARRNPVAAKSRIGFLPQKPPLHMDLTVCENLEHCAGLKLIPPKQIARSVDKVLDQCNLTHFRNRVVKNLSGGYQQRVGIAQAIINDPDMVVLDEPTNGLDPNQIIDIRSMIRDIAQERTVILSTHILPEAHAECDNILMVEQGQLIFNASIEEFDNYISPNSIIVSMLDAPDCETIRRVGEVSSVESLSSNRFRIRCTDPTLTSESLIRESVQNNWRLIEINIEKNSMDEIFAELSKRAK